MAKHILKR